MTLSAATRRALLFGLAITVAHAAVMIALVGYAGGSRAVSVGLETLVEDHLSGLLIAALAAGATAWVVAARLDLRGEQVRAMGGLILAELVLSGLVVAVVGELIFLHVPLVFVAATGLGSQLLAAAAGLLFASLRPGAAA